MTNGAEEMTDKTRPAFGDPFTSHVGYTSTRTGERTASSWIDMRPDLLDGRGRLHPGVLAFLVDSTAGVVCGTAALPSWVVTADLQFEVVDLPAVGPARADAVVRRPGRRQSCGEVTVHDEGDNDRIVAVGTVNHIVVANDQPLGEVPTDMAVGERLGPALPPHPAPVPPLVELLHVERMRDGSVELPIVGVAVNPLGFLHGGLSCLANSLRGVPTVVVADTAYSECDGFDPFQQISMVRYIQLGENFAIGNYPLTLQGVVQFDSVYPNTNVYGLTLIG